MGEATWALPEADISVMIWQPVGLFGLRYCGSGETVIDIESPVPFEGKSVVTPWEPPFAEPVPHSSVVRRPRCAQHPC